MKIQGIISQVGNLNLCQIHLAKVIILMSGGLRSFCFGGVKISWIEFFELHMFEYLKVTKSQTFFFTLLVKVHIF